MSYILEALKKADRERDFGAVPGLATPQEVERPQPRSRRWPWLITALLGVNALLLVVLLKGRVEESPAAVQAPSLARTTLDNSQPAQVIEKAAEVVSSEAPAPQQIESRESARKPSTGGLVMLPESAASPESGPIKQLEDTLPDPADNMVTADEARQLPSWYELPQALRNSLSPPRLDLHAYSEEPRNRFVLVNLKKYREGDTLDGGLLLVEILPDGMVLSYQGERFFVEK